MRVAALVFVVGSMVFWSAPAVLAEPGKAVVGWVEKVELSPGDVTLNAKLDTGADICSLHASNIVEFERKGDKWVRFNITDRYGKEHVWEREVWRVARIKRHGKKEPQLRNVIRAGVCLGENFMLTDIGLVDRRNFNYQLLLGRSFLASLVVIDPAVSYTVKPNCKQLEKQ